VYVIDQNESSLFDLIDPLQRSGLWVHGRVGDIRDPKTVNDTFEDFHPQIVYNVAAYKHVPLMEYTPLEAIQTNVIGHYNLIHSAKTHREWMEKFVFISTDKAISSNSIMGATKRLGEIITKNQGKGYINVRFGNVLGSRGSLMSIWQRQHDSGLPLSVTDPEMERYMMTIPEAVELVIQATERGEGGETFCLDMGKKWNILELAKEIIKTTGGEVSITGVRPGETMTEDIMTEEEAKIAKREGRFLIIK
jgi:FlaA1/EpsC-like NDP-sugar epimerase